MVLAALVIFGLGYWFRGVVREPAAGSLDAPAESAAAPLEVWTCSMHPEIRRSRPGRCPVCGMDLVHVEAGAPAAAKQPKYACSMFCVPPLPHPGKCPICGMEMVEVETEAPAGDAPAPPRTLTLTPLAQQLAGVRVAPVERKFVTAEVGMIGKVDYDETRLRYIAARVPGRLDRLYVDYTGVPVREGDHLVYLYSPELLAAQEELLQAKRVTTAATEGGGESASAARWQWLEDIRAKLRLWGLTDAQIEEIEARGAPTDHLTIYAPSGGVVIDKNAVEGMYVETGTRIYTIADLSRVWVKLDAYESDLVFLRYGQPVEFEVQAYPGEKFSGRIAFIDPVLDGRTRTVKVRVNVPNVDGRLKPEMFVRARVYAQIAAGGRVMNSDLAGKWISPMHPEIVKDGPGACDVCGMPLVPAESLGYVAADGDAERAPLVVPRSAPLLTGRRAVVYVELPDAPGTYQGREVVLGARAGDDYVVREGLHEGERVVVNGNFKLDSAMQIRAEPSMMSPAGGRGPTGAEHHGSHTGGSAGGSSHHE